VSPAPSGRSAGAWRCRLIGLLTGVTLVATARSADLPTALLACREVQDNDARLACFDRESARLAALAEATTPLTPEDRFGLPRAVTPTKEETGPRRQEATVLRARLRLVASRSDGLIVFTLDNGQVWRQLEPGSDLFARPGDAVQLSKGAFGNYWLRGASGRTCRVVRDR